MYQGMNTQGYNPMIREQNMLLSLLIEAMKDERSDYVKYKKMIDSSKSEKVRKQIEFAYNDEGKHYKMFQQIYYVLTGQYMDIPLPEPPKFETMLDAIESSINGELEAVELYRKIRAALPTTQLRDMFYEIITDEQEHATRFVYLYCLEK